MADDRMKNDDLQKNMDGAGHDEGQKFGQQSPGRSGQGQQSGQQGQHAGGYGGSQQGQQRNFGNREDDEEFGAGGAGQGGQNRGGQNRGGQNR